MTAPTAARRDLWLVILVVASALGTESAAHGQTPRAQKGLSPLLPGRATRTASDPVKKPGTAMPSRTNAATTSLGRPEVRQTPGRDRPSRAIVTRDPGLVRTSDTSSMASASSARGYGGEGLVFGDGAAGSADHPQLAGFRGRGLAVPLGPDERARRGPRPARRPGDPGSGAGGGRGTRLRPVASGRGGLDRAALEIPLELHPRPVLPAVVVADAGDDLLAIARHRVTLNGIRSSPRERSVYRWIQVEGPPVRGREDQAWICSFIPPEAGTYRFLLVTAAEGAISQPDEVVLSVTQRLARANRSCGRRGINHRRGGSAGYSEALD